MKYQKVIGILLTLSLATFAIVGELSFASVTNIQTIITGSSHTDSNADDTADFPPFATDAITNNSDDQRYGNPGNRYERYVGLGFDLSSTNGNPHRGDCSGKGYENTSGGDRYCGEASPSD